MNIHKSGSFLPFFIIFFTSFLLGMLFLYSIQQKGGVENVKNIEKQQEKDKQLSLKKYFQVYDLIQKNYFDEGGIKTEKLIDSTVAGLVKGLEDTHSEYLNAQENKLFKEQIDGDFEGIGAYIDEHPLGVKVAKVMDDSPAQKAGIKNGDVITKVNGEDIGGLSVTKSVQKIKGPAKSKVILEILRSSEVEALQIEAIREKIKVDSVLSKSISEDIGYISIQTFGEETANDFKEALREFSQKKGIIIDLRNNGGGLLSSAVEILSTIVEPGKVIVKTRYKNTQKEEVYTSQNTGNIYAGKIVILVNEFSASASEITAGALKDYKKAIIVGKKTYGKGSVQNPFELGDGSMLKLTIAKWFTPNGINIDHDGILPDIKVDLKKYDYDLYECKKAGKCEENLTEEKFEVYDRQKEEAKKILKTFIKTNSISKTVENFSQKADTK